MYELGTMSNELYVRSDILGDAASALGLRANHQYSRHHSIRHGNRFRTDSIGRE
jgi:hypothetical protein